MNLTSAYRNDPINNIEWCGQAAEPVVVKHEVMNGVPSVLVEVQEWSWWQVRNDYRVTGRYWREARGRELGYFSRDGDVWTLRDASVRHALGWQQAFSDLEPARKQFEKIQIGYLGAVAAAPAAASGGWLAVGREFALDQVGIPNPRDIWDLGRTGIRTVQGFGRRLNDFFTGTRWWQIDLADARAGFALNPFWKSLSLKDADETKALVNVLMTEDTAGIGFIQNGKVHIFNATRPDRDIWGHADFIRNNLIEKSDDLMGFQIFRNLDDKLTIHPFSELNVNMGDPNARLPSGVVEQLKELLNL
jgi:hypothetical protein